MPTSVENAERIPEKKEKNVSGGCSSTVVEFSRIQLPLVKVTPLTQQLGPGVVPSHLHLQQGAAASPSGHVGHGTGHVVLGAGVSLKCVECRYSEATFILFSMCSVCSVDSCLGANICDYSIISYLYEQ